MISPETIEEVVRTANVYDVISDYITLEKAGSNYRALCPFHQEKTPSFMVSPTKNIFKCFGCGISGNAVKFVMEYEGLSFPEAIIKLAEKYNIPVKYIKSENTKVLKGLYKITERISYFYKEQLKKSKEAKDYLNKRDILFSTADLFNLGYSPENPDELLSFCKKEGIDIKRLEEVGVVTFSEKGITDRFRGRIIFPIRDHRGRVVAFGGRVIKEGREPKYLNSPETKIYSKSKVLYGLFESKDFLREKKEAVIVEGYFDLISLYQIGIKNVVATLGTAFTVEHGKLLKRFVKRAYLLFDSDKAGKKAALNTSKILLSLGMEVFYVPLEEKDPDILAKSGRKAVENLLLKSKDFLIFLLERIKNEKELKKQKKLIDLYLDVLGYLPDKHVKGLYLKSLSDETGIPINMLEVPEKSVKQGEEELEGISKYLYFSEKIILKTLIYNRDEILRSFNEFDKIEGSEHFLYLINSIIEGQISEDELEEIKNLPVEPNISAALNALEQLHKKWLKKQIEISAIFNKVDESILSLILKK